MSKHFFLLLLCNHTASNAGALDPDCDPGKTAKSAAMKVTVGVGGRCSAKETVKDMSKEAAGIEEKGPIEKRRKDDGLVKKATKKALNLSFTYNA